MSTFAELAESFQSMASSKRTWLENFSAGKNKRPDWEISTKQRQLMDLEEGASWFRKAASRDERKQA